MKHYIVYIPGLGDKYDGLRRFFLSFWRLYGVTVELVPMTWYDGKAYDDKFERVKSVITNAQALGFTVTVIGESAGASMALNVFATNKEIHRFISLCGVNNAKTPISSRIFKKGPAFEESVSYLSSSRANTMKDRIDQMTVITAKHDATVPIEKNVIPGARQVRVWSVGHLTTITLCLSLFSSVVVREVKRHVS